MAIGPFIRKKLGPLEKPVSDAYRNFFMSMDDLTLKIKSKVPNAGNILEIGCGEGAIIDLLCDLYSSTFIKGIDIIDHVGRQFSKHSNKVSFEKIRIEDYLLRDHDLADLIYVGDVMHHIPNEQHYSFLSNARKALKPQGVLCLKDIDSKAGIIANLVDFTDRYITGDEVNYLNIDEFIGLIKSVFGENVKFEFDYIKPWRSNIIFYIYNN
jgi:SAM-dependent methyltransferase